MSNKYKIGDKVFYMENNKSNSGTILKAATISIDDYEGSIILTTVYWIQIDLLTIPGYYDMGFNALSEEELFASENDLINNIIKK